MAPHHDGLGVRRLGHDGDGGETELLCLRRELAGVPSFEFALRERVSRLSSFRHPSYARVRSVERSADPDSPLHLVSDRVAGIRLSELLGAAESRQLPFDVGAALCLVRQLVPAVAILHETARDASHGAIAPERLIVTGHARLVVAEYVLGSALEQLLFPRERYWTQLRVALPRVAGLARFDHLADVTQIGVVALSLILGRPLKDDEFPARIPDLVAGAQACSASGDHEPLAPVLKVWLERTLQLDPRQSFPSAIEARAALDRAVDESGYDTSPANLQELLARVENPERPAPVKRQAVAAAKPGPAAAVVRPASDAVAVPQLIPAAAASVPEPAAPKARAAIAAAAENPARATTTPVPPPSLLLGSADMDGASGRQGRSSAALIGVALAAALLVGTAGTFAVRHMAAEKEELPKSGTLAVTTEPAGAQMTIDGVAQGVTPRSVTLAPGTHRLVVRGAHGQRQVSVTIVAGGQVNQFLDLPQPVPAPVVVTAPAPVVEAPPPPAAPASPAAGWLAVTSAFDIQVFEGGKLVGTSDTERVMVPAGTHEFEFVNETLGFRLPRKVEIGAGKVAAVAVEPPKGILALNAVPWAEVTIDGQAAGETPLGNVSVPIGRHDVVFRHPELGEQKFSVDVTLKGPARLSADMRKR